MKTVNVQLRDLESPEVRALRTLAEYLHEHLPWESKRLTDPLEMTPVEMVSYTITLLSLAKRISTELPEKLYKLVQEITTE
mgnify:CR=1 FL=1